MTWRSIFLTLWLSTFLAACTIVFPGRFSYPGVTCRNQSGWCIVQVPSVGDLAYGAGNSGDLDYTILSFRMAPREGVTAAWSSAEITLVDRDTGKSMQVKALDTKPVTGRKLDPYMREDLFVLYGPYSPGEYRLEPRIAKLEIRLPPIISDARTVEVAPLRVNDGTRLPMPVFLFGGH
jgi:hypothetical protein